MLIMKKYNRRNTRCFKDMLAKENNWNHFVGVILHNIRVMSHHGLISAININNNGDMDIRYE